MFEIKGSKKFKERYLSEVSNTLNGYYFEDEIINQFLEKMVYMGFGVEQIERGISPSTFKFYSKSKKLVKEIISHLKNERFGNIYSITENDSYVRISCKIKSRGVVPIEIFKAGYENCEEFFNKHDFKHSFNNCSYSYSDNKIFVKDLELFRFRVENYNKVEDDMNWFKEFACEDMGGEYANCEPLKIENQRFVHRR